jgi:hypothetical protein
VTPDGQIAVNDIAVRSEDLFTVLSAALQGSREKVVILRGDKAVLLGQAVNILDIAQQAGAREHRARHQAAAGARGLGLGGLRASTPVAVFGASEEKRATTAKSGIRPSTANNKDLSLHIGSFILRYEVRTPESWIAHPLLSVRPMAPEHPNARGAPRKHRTLSAPSFSTSTHGLASTGSDFPKPSTAECAPPASRPPRAIQAQVIPAALDGPRRPRARPDRHRQDRRVRALPLLERMLEPGAPGPRALILAPTRELARRSRPRSAALARFTRIRTATIYGGVSLGRRSRR